MKFSKKLMETIEKAGWIMTEDNLCYNFQTYSPAGQDFYFCIDKNKSVDLDTLGSEIYDYYNCFDVSEASHIWLDSTGHGKNGAPYEMIDVYKDMEWCENKIYELFEIIQHEEIRQRNLYYLYIEDWCDSRNVSVEDVDEETGINGGECYACFSEFCDNEYLDEDYMLELEKNLD